MAPALSLAALLLAHDADSADVATLASMARDAVAIGAAPVVVALPPTVEPPTGARVARTRPGGPPVTAMRLGMAQLTNTVARWVLLLPLRGERQPLAALVALVDTATRARDSMVAFAGLSLDDSPVLVPRAAWLELVTLGENGLEALASRRRVERVDAPLE
jgi:hypothetical protein